MDYNLNLELFKTSSAGVNVDSAEELVKIEYDYSAVAWFFVAWFGTTRLPKKISFTCTKTDEVFEVLTDKKLIEHYMLYRKK
jgi:hypothetical protein